MCGLAQKEDPLVRQAPDTSWYDPLWRGVDTLAEVCEVGACVADLVALPARRPLVTAVDLPMAETQGALSVERVWTGQRGGLFGPGWESVWDIAVVSGRLVGPLPALPLEAPAPGRTVHLADGSTLRLGDNGKIEELCPDGARCVSAIRTADSIVLTGERATHSASSVTLKLTAGRVTEASAGSRTATYSYTGGRLSDLTTESGSTSYSYEGKRLTRVATGDTERTYSYDAGRVTSTVDSDGGKWLIRESDGRIEVVTPEGPTRTYRFDNGLLLEVEDSEQGVLLRRDVSGGRLVSDVRPLDGVSTAFLDDGSIRVTEQQADAPPRVAVMAMDNAGRVTRVQGIDGLTEISYDGTSKRPATVERNGAVTTLGYDDNGLLVRSEDADGYTVEVTRNPAGLPVRVSDGLLDQRFTYDEAGRPVTEGHGARQAKARYDQDGRPLEITDRAGHQLQPAYDSTGRLTGIGGGAGSGTAADDLAVLANGLGAVLGGDEPGVGELTVQAIVGGKGEPQTYTYTNGDQAQFDSWGRLLSVTVDGRTTSRTYDQAGRLTTLTVPGNQTYRLSYSPAGRVATVSDGTVEATLTWHGDLLTRAETSAGSTYTYNYDTEGRLTTATVGDLAWSYRYDPTGLVTLVARPTGSTYYQWDDLGRPVRMVETGVDERYAWYGSGADLKMVTRNGEPAVTIDRNQAGQVVGVQGAGSNERSTFTYAADGTLTAFSLPGGFEATIDYLTPDENNVRRVASLTYGGRTERWGWVGDEVGAVFIGDDIVPHQLTWSAPGLLGQVTRGNETLMSMKVGETGRVEEIRKGDDTEPVAALGWSAAGLAEASFDGVNVAITYDAEHRPRVVASDDDRAEWAWADGALARTEVGTDVISFGLADGHLSTSTHTHGDDEPTTVTWDATGTRPERVTSAEGPVDFVYGEGAVLTQVRYGNDNTVRTVRHENGEAKADDAAGALLDDLFDEQGHFSIAGGRTLDTPFAPWFDHLPSELGVSLPDVVTGTEVVSTAVDHALPDPPMPLIPSDDVAGDTARQVLGLAATASLPVGPDRLVDVELGAGGSSLDMLASNSATMAVAGSTLDHLGPGDGWLERYTRWGGDLIGWIGRAGSAAWAFLTDTTVGRAVLSAMFMAASFVSGIACGVATVCAGGVAVSLFVLEALAASQGESVLSSLVAAAVAPLDDLRRASSGEPLAILSTLALVASLAGTFGAASIVRMIPAQALAPVCNLKRMVCVSVSRFGDAAEHVVDAQRNGAARLLKVDRPGAQARRNSALRDIDARTGFDRDEYPFAVSSRRDGLSIRHIDPTSNRALGSYLGHQLNPLPDGARFFVMPIA